MADGVAKKRSSTSVETWEYKVLQLSESSQFLKKLQATDQIEQLSTISTMIPDFYSIHGTIFEPYSKKIELRLLKIPPQQNNQPPLLQRGGQFKKIFLPPIPPAQEADLRRPSPATSDTGPRGTFRQKHPQHLEHSGQEIEMEPICEKGMGKHHG